MPKSQPLSPENTQRVQKEQDKNVNCSHVLVAKTQTTLNVSSSIEV